jgi:hypothetical protein
VRSVKRCLRSSAVATFSVLLGVATFGGTGSATVAGAVTHAPRIPAAHPTTRATTNQWASTNWSGYAVPGTNFTSVSGTFTVPTITGKNKGKPTYTSAWVGIDGFKNQNLIQAGFGGDWAAGAATYYAWWEILPAAETQIPTSAVPVHPGDVMTVTITQGSPKWTITVTNVTASKSFTTQQKYTGPGTSAEWIDEAPSVNGRIAKLANYGTNVFSAARINGANPHLVVSESGVMVKGKKVISSPSAPNSTGDGFAMQYGPVAPPPPS